MTVLKVQNRIAHEWASVKRECNERFKGPRVSKKKKQFTHERVELGKSHQKCYKT
jgi:hypothetical protein